MARRKPWDTKPDKTVFGSASNGIKVAINSMAAAVVKRFQVAPVPTAEALKMVVRPEDHEILRKARRLMGNQQRGNSIDLMLKFDESKGEWATRARVRLRIEGHDPDQILVPDYCAPGHYEAAMGKEFTKGNLLPGASMEHAMALEHGVRDLIEVAHDWAMVQALFDYFDSKPETYRRTNVRFMWSGIMPLLRMGGESCQGAALTLQKVSETGWCNTPPEIYPAIKHANEVIARGQLLMDQTNSDRFTSAIGFALPYVMCGEINHPQWSLGTLQPKL